MPRYIDADKVMDEIKRIGGHYLCEWDTIGVCALIERQPTADVEEVKHGEWILHDYAEVIEHCAIPNYECSVCGIWKREDSDYCPDCGAKMYVTSKERGGEK